MRGKLELNRGVVKLRRLRWLMVSFMSVLVGLALVRPLGAAAKWVIVHQASSGLVVHRSSMRRVNNSRVHYVKVPKSYAHVKKTSATHEIKATKGKGVTFKTKYLLPFPGKNGQRWGNPQSIAISKSNYMYIVYCPTNVKNRGRIVRFNMALLAKLGVDKSPKRLQSAYVKHHGRYSASQKQIQKAIKVGPTFTTGHGQSLAYNYKTKALYMWRDTEKSARVPTSMWGVIQHISSKSLRPDRAVRFRLASRGMRVPGGHTLAFDKSGNAYFWSNPGVGGYVYKGKISAHHVKFRLTSQILRHIPGTRIQSMGYNPVRHRLYMVSDGSIASFPTKRLNGRGSLTNGSFEWSGLSPKRELEGLAYDSAGHGYLLTNHNPEVLVAGKY